MTYCIASSTTSRLKDQHNSAWLHRPPPTGRAVIPQDGLVRKAPRAYGRVGSALRTARRRLGEDRRAEPEEGLNRRDNYPRPVKGERLVRSMEWAPWAGQ